MSDTMSAEEMSANLDKILDEYCLSKGIKHEKNNNDADAYLDMSAQQIKSLTAIECGIGAYLIEQRAYYIQNEFNKENGRANWAKSVIAMAIADKINNYHGYGYEEKSKQAIKDNAFTKKLEYIRTMAQNRADRLFSLAQRLSSISKTLSNLQYLKGGNRNAE